LTSKGEVANLSLAGDGKRRIEWADRQMPVLAEVRERFRREMPLRGIRMASCLHVTTATAVLARTLKAGGAEVTLCASNPLSTQDDVAASLVQDSGIATFAINGEDKETYYNHIDQALQMKPHVTMDDGADVVTRLHVDREDLAGEMIGGTEDSTTGVISLRNMAAEGSLKYPVMAVNDAVARHMVDNRYGAGQSTLDGIIRATNILIAGRTVVVAGYGWCGRGVAFRSRGLGGHVIVTEVDPIRSLEAVMDGFRVMPMTEAAALGDLFITVTGNKHVLRAEHYKNMKDGAILANSGHFNVELDIPALAALSGGKKREVRRFVDEYKLQDGRSIYLLGKGRLINSTATEGHPAAVMDMSFANQALASEYIVKNADKLENKVYTVPSEIDREIARLKLGTLGFRIDRLTSTQNSYLGSGPETI
jgi:adenosylhomocysteinase